MNGWFDAHNHLQDARLGDAREIARTMKREGVETAIVNATCQADWNEVHARVARSMGDEQAPELLPAFGVHPWQAASVDEGWLDDLRDYLVTHPQASVGEIGLDRWVDSPSLEVQRPVFRAQLELAVQLRRPVIIHCLKAWGDLLEQLQACPPQAPFLMHSYGGSLEFAQRLIPQGAYFSFSGHFLQERKASVVEVFRQLPKDRILMETDAPDMLPPAAQISHALPEGINHPANLAAVGEALADRLGVEPESWRELTAENARRCFGL